ncbi:hypothetical protein KP509_33G055400 [Ceratopteris richardii]|uniref:Cyanovirin-N domain-containing protein n=1 Tax=Ceratopteris richardii TaxID=49495 RepID=A0A8T2QRA9_CERRI|nr:hypothetical protein KP509_33G055400 [Ceratopteris richardii]
MATRPILGFTFVFLVLVCSNANAICNFAATCIYQNLSFTLFSASCADVSGHDRFSALQLNFKIGNVNGNLVCPGANFAASCSNIFLSGGHTLLANCKNSNGALIQTSLDLNNCIQNINGELYFCV